MNVIFFEPPAEQKTGGLEVAIRSLERFLGSAGVNLRCNPPIGEVVDAEPPTVVHFHGLWQRRFLNVSAHCRRRSIPYVVSTHGMLEPWAWRHKLWKKWPWYHLFERQHLAGAAALLATSQPEAKNLAKFFPNGNRRAIPLGLTSDRRPNWANARQKLGWPHAEMVLLYLSRLHPKKGLHLLLQALAGLEPSYRQNVRLVVVGGGEARYVGIVKRLEQRLSAHLPKVDWVGEVWDDAKWDYLQGADLFCLPSFTENFGLAILEALQVGTRVLTTDRTPWSVIDSWDAGAIVPPTTSAIRSALEDFLVHRSWSGTRREELASEVHARFSWEAIGPSYLRFYAESATRSDAAT